MEELSMNIQEIKKVSESYVVMGKAEHEHKFMPTVACEPTPTCPEIPEVYPVGQVEINREDKQIYARLYNRVTLEECAKFKQIIEGIDEIKSTGFPIFFGW